MRGSGLGLAIAEQLVRANGGAMRLASPPGGGFVVTVDLPVVA
nr:ATP-binding protein [Pseudonocardia nigra]